MHRRLVLVLCATVPGPLALYACTDDEPVLPPVIPAFEAGAEGFDAAATQIDSATADAGPDVTVAAEGGSDAGVVTLSDPAPTVSQPGKTTCAGCPDTTATDFDVDVTGTAYRYTGTVTGAVGDGVFYVTPIGAGAAPPFMTGTIPTSGGTWDVTVPLFCGEQLLKAVWTNASGKLVVATRIVTGTCTEPDIRVTMTWDATGRDWELHLIRPGGRINDQTNKTDCTWTTCIGSSPDWGVATDPSDDPKKDVDNTGAYGPENIFLSKPEAGRYTVMVEHWSSGGGATSSGFVIVNVKGQPTVAIKRESLAPYRVWTAATIDWPAKTTTPSQAVFDCSGSWSSGCTATIP